MFKQVRLNDAILKFYQRSQPIAFSNAETLYDDLILLRDQILMYGDLSEAQTNYLNNFIDKFDIRLTDTIKDIFDKWIEDGFLVDTLRRIINEEVVEARDGEARLKVRLDRDYQHTQTQINQLKEKDIEHDGKINDNKDKIFDLELTKIDGVAFDLPTYSIVFYSGSSIVESIDISQPSNAVHVQNYIDSLISNGQISGIQLSDDSIQYKHLTNYFMFDEVTNLLASEDDDLNALPKSGLYLTGAYVKNRPEIGTGVPIDGTAVVVNFNANSGYGIQIYHAIDNKVWYRIKKLNTPAGFTEWKSMVDNDDFKALEKYSTINQYPFLSEEDDLDDLIENGKWIAINPINSPLPNEERSWMVQVETFRTVKDHEVRWGYQLLTTIHTDTQGVYFRRFSNTRIAGEIVPRFFGWERLDNSLDGDSSSLSGQTIVNFGDSIFGNHDDSSSISSYISHRTNAVSLNIGFGGSRVAEHEPYWDAFSWYRLVDEIIKPNTDQTKWNLQEQAITASQTGVLSGMPEYFRRRLDRLKDIDFSSVDIVTLSAGTNDFTSKKVNVDNTSNKEDIKTYAGSLRYGIRKLLEKYPHIKIMLCTPIYRFWLENGSFVDDSDEREFISQKLTDFVSKTKEVGKEFKIPVLDNYYELGINFYNKYQYFPLTDGTHPNENGRKLIGNKIGEFLINNY